MNNTIKEIQNTMNSASQINLLNNNDRYTPGIVELKSCKVIFEQGNSFRPAQVIYIGELGEYFATITQNYNIGKPHKLHPWDAKSYK